MNAPLKFLAGRHAALKFAIVGGIGFCLDAALLVLLFDHLHLELAWARSIAFLCAATLNWFLNRHFTFRERLRHDARHLEWARFVTSALLSAVPNLGLFFLLMLFLPETLGYVMFAMCCGILAGYYCNYQLARGWVFRLQSR
jgi:putative flippase GtrA